MQERRRRGQAKGQTDPCPAGAESTETGDRESLLGGPPRPLERVYDEQIAPLLAHIHDLCVAQGIDHIVYFALDRDSDRLLAAGSSFVAREGMDHVRLAEALLFHGSDLTDDTSEYEPRPRGDA